MKRNKCFLLILQISEYEICFRGSTVFWSGNKLEAARYAEKINGTIIEGKSCRKVFDCWDWLKYKYLEWRTETPLDKREIWRVVLTKYAKYASRKGTYVHTEDYTGWVWDNV